MHAALMPLLAALALSAAPPTVHIDGAEALYGSPFRVRVERLAPGEAVTVTARSVDNRKAVWEASAVFRADSKGTVDLDTQAPESGSYTGADGLGLLWSMKPLGVPAGKERSYAYLGLDHVTVTFTAATGQGPSAPATLQRFHQMPGQPLVRVPLHQDGLRGVLYHPADGRPHPAVIQLNGSNGGMSEWLAQALASHGFATLALAYFGHDDLPAEMDEIPLEYFGKAMRWMQTQPGVKRGRVALVGGSRGGELALLLGSLYPEVGAVVAWVPNSIVWQTESMARQAKGQVVSAWSLGGKGIPYAPFLVTAEDMDQLAKGTLRGTRHMADMARLDPAVFEAARIPVEKLRGPVLLVSGTDDQTGPSDVASRMVMERLAQVRHPHEYRHVENPGGGHQSFLPRMITGFSSYMNGGNARDDAHGGMRSWAETLAFLKRHVK